MVSDNEPLFLSPFQGALLKPPALRVVMIMTPEIPKPNDRVTPWLLKWIFLPLINQWK
jgi:hypothetical protein